MAYSKKEEEKIFNLICDKIEQGKSVTSILNEKSMPSSKTFWKWLKNDEAKVKYYTRMCEKRADAIFEEILTISDNVVEGVVVKEVDGRVETIKGDMIQHRRLQVDARKWMLSKMQPKKYGDKIDHTTNGKDINKPKKLIIKVKRNEDN